MQYYAIQHKRSGRFISGTDFSSTNGKPRQIYSNSLRPPKLFNGEELTDEIKLRNINLKNYRVVVVEVRKAVI